MNGCCFSCKGCLATRFKARDFTEITTEDMADWVLSKNVEGLTISGGEPMLQAEALAEIVDIVRKQRDCGVIVYTGFAYEALLEKHDIGMMKLLRVTDLLIDGPYIQELDNNQPYRGSANQRLLPLTDRYRLAIDTYYSAASAREIELHLSTFGTLMAGVPGKEQRKVWEKIRELGDLNGN